MQGKPKVIAALNEALVEELMAINQYFLHAEMCENWHYDKLGSYIKNVKDQLESDLALEIHAVEMYNRASAIAREEGDNASRELFERLLKDEEEHVDWLEAQLHQIREMGYERYLSQQIREEK
jgi:bacterioferritin